MPTTTDEVGYFESPVRPFADWLASDLGPAWEAREVEGRLSELLRQIAPGGDYTRFLLLPVGTWTCMMSDGPGGTDIGLLPSHAARKVPCRAIRAVRAEPGDAPYPATILAVYAPDAVDDSLRCRRVLTAANDGGRWVFDSFGEPFGFEDVGTYEKRRIRDRFTGEMLMKYLVELGAPAGPFAPADWVSGAYLVEDREA
ncbi:hypothetical protein [Nitriliruptor alkaliphilus]|uniref:hypothetical protein n=1 Tax=Nitriliruptor alkaliphilus TaxID=427918 RepID=UPI0006983E01|nr:hypothetical protein [Nitriliruptor alkaliphilus]